MNMKILVTLILLTSFAFAAGTFSTCGAVLNSAGVWTLTADIVNQYPASYCVEVTSANVVIDCQGKMIDGDDPYATHGTAKLGIHPHANANLTIKNCYISDWYAGVSEWVDLMVGPLTIINTTFRSNEVAGIYAFTQALGNVTILNSTFIGPEMGFYSYGWDHVFNNVTFANFTASEFWKS